MTGGRSAAPGGRCLRGDGRNTQRRPGIEDARRERGQSLVEFALVLPVLLLMMLVALDFGRVYLGYVNLQNLARIAANFAASEPDAWGGTPDSATQDRYRAIVLNDARATNCDLPGNPDTVAAPTFEDRNGDGDTDDLGDLARVRLTCSFGIITPGIAGIVGSPLSVSAEAAFPIKEGLGRVPTSGGGGGGVGPTAAFAANDTDGAMPFTVQFMDESGGNPTSWLWDFGDGSASSLRDPVHTYTAPGVYDVSLMVGNGTGSHTLMKAGYVFVSDPEDEVAFEGEPTSGMAPLEVRFTDRSSGDPTAWQWDFGDGHTSTDQNPVHTYLLPGTYDVTLTITTADPGVDGDGQESLMKVAYVNVGVGLCTVPDFVNTKTKWSNAQDVWEDANFTTQVAKLDPSVKGNFTIKYQSLTGNSPVPCSSTIEVDD